MWNSQAAGILNLFQHLQAWEPQASSVSAQKQGWKGPLLRQQPKEVRRPILQQDTYNWWTLTTKKYKPLKIVPSAHNKRRDVDSRKSTKTW